MICRLPMQPVPMQSGTENPMIEPFKNLNEVTTDTVVTVLRITHVEVIPTGAMKITTEEALDHMMNMIKGGDQEEVMIIIIVE